MDPQISFFINFFIKNGSHSTIHTFKNYFTTVFSVLSFQFQQNKFYPNRPLKWKQKKVDLGPNQIRNGYASKRKDDDQESRSRNGEAQPKLSLQ